MIGVDRFGPGINAAISCDPALFTVLTRDRFGNRLAQGGETGVTVELNPASSENVVAIVSDNSDGTYAVQYTARHPCRCAVRVLVRQKELARSPFSLNIAGADAVMCSAAGTGLSSAVAGELAQFIVTTRTTTGELVWLAERGHELHVLVVSRSNEADFNAQGSTQAVVTETRNKAEYRVEYSLNLEGRAELHVLLGSNKVTAVHIHGSPFVLQVVPAALDGMHCRASGDGLSHAVVEKEAEFTITTYDKYDNRISRGGAHLDTALTQPNENKVICQQPAH